MEKKFLKELNEYNISYEILMFLDWLNKSHPKLLSSFVKKSIQKGFFQDIQTQSLSLQPEEIHSIIVNFFENIDKSLAQESNCEHNIKNTTICDDMHNEISLCSNEITHMKEHNTLDQELLVEYYKKKNNKNYLKKILKQWRPEKNISIN